MKITIPVLVFFSLVTVNLIKANESSDNSQTEVFNDYLHYAILASEKKGWEIKSSNDNEIVAEKDNVYKLGHHPLRIKITQEDGKPVLKQISTAKARYLKEYNTLTQELRSLIDKNHKSIRHELNMHNNYNKSDSTQFVRLYADLKRLKDLLDNGLISQDEFELLKLKVINRF